MILGLQKAIKVYKSKFTKNNRKTLDGFLNDFSQRGVIREEVNNNSKWKQAKKFLGLPMLSDSFRLH